MDKRKMRLNKNGSALRRYMKERGMRFQRELARELGLSDSMICLYFQGRKSFSPTTALRIVRHTGIPMEQLYQ